MEEMRIYFRKIIAGMMALLLTAPANPGGFTSSGSTIPVNAEEADADRSGIYGDDLDDDLTTDAADDITTDTETSGGEDSQEGATTQEEDDIVPDDTDDQNVVDDETTSADDQITTDSQDAHEYESDEPKNAENTVVVPKDENGSEAELCFIKISSAEDVLDKIDEISPEEAQSWLAANIDAITAIAPAYNGRRDFFFKYNDTYYYASLGPDRFESRYIGGDDFYWAVLSADKVEDSIAKYIKRMEHVFIWKNPAATYTKIDAHEATCTESGNTEYYIGSDNKYYKLEDGVYKEIAENSWTVDALGHSYSAPVWTWIDDVNISAKFVCKNCGDVVVFDTQETKKIESEPTYTHDGKVEYNARVVFNGKGYSYTKYVNIPKLRLSYVEASDPTCTEAGNIEYWYDADNDKYFADENGENEITKANTVIKATGHTAGSEVVENKVEPTYFHDGSYDKVVYCSKCGEEISREHITITKPKYTAPALKYAKGENAVKLSWDAVEGAEKYGIAGYVSGRWLLLYDCDDTSFILNGLTEGTQYWVSVITMSEGKWVTDFSNAIVVTPQSTAGKYPVLKSVEHNEPTHQFKLTWTAVKGAQQYGIGVYLKGKWKVITQDIPGDRTSYISPKLTAGQTYTLVIVAKVDGKWVLNNLNARSFTVTVQPEAPLVAGAYESDDFVFSGNVFIVGDSTVCEYKPESTAAKGSCGWGMKLAQQFEGVKVTNLARAGRSSRSFMNDPEYTRMCDSIGKGDYLFIQFGHNDERTAEPNHAAYPYLDFSTLDNEGKNDNGQYSYEWILLNKYVRVAQAKGATPVLVTPITRRHKDGRPDFEGHVNYADAIVKLGKKYNIPVIDMTTKTKDLYYELYSKGGAEATAEMHCYLDESRTTIDNTHLSVKGSEIIADMIADETKTLELKISERLK